MANNHWLDTTLPTIMCGIGPLKLGITQATSNHVPWEEYGTYPLNSMGHKLLDVEACRSHDRGESSWNKPK